MPFTPSEPLEPTASQLEETPPVPPPWTVGGTTFFPEEPVATAAASGTPADAAAAPAGGTPGVDVPVPSPGLGGVPVAAAMEPAPGPFEQAIRGAADTLGGAAAPIMAQAPEPVRNLADIVGQPVGGTVDALTNITGELGQGDIPGAVGAGLGAMSGPQERVIEQTVQRLAEGKSAIPINEVFQNPGDILAILGGLATTYGPAAALGHQTLEDWWNADPVQAQQILATEGPAGVHQRWMEDIGASDVPPPQLSNPFDAATSDNPIERAGQIIGAVPGFVGGWGEAAQQGTLTPFLIGQAQALFEDPTTLIPARLSGMAGQRMRGAAGAQVAKIPGVGPALGKVVSGTRAEGAAAAGEPGNTGRRQDGGTVTPLLTDHGPIFAGPEGTGPLKQLVDEASAAEAPAPLVPLKLEPAPTRDVTSTFFDDEGGLLTLRRRGQRYDRLQERTATKRRLKGRQPLSPPPSPLSLPPSPRSMVTPSGEVFHSQEHHPLAPAIRKRFEEMGLYEYALILVNRIEDILPADAIESALWPSALHDPVNRLIVVALEHARDADFGELGGKVRTITDLDHEVVHAARSLDLFTPIEWDVLVKTAKKQEIDRIVRENPAYRNLSPAEFQQEMVAHLYQFWRQGRLIGHMPVVGLLERLQKFLIGLGRALYDTYPEGIMELLEAGEITRRLSNEPEGGHLPDAETDALLERLGIPRGMIDDPPALPPGDTLPALPDDAPPALSDELQYSRVNYPLYHASTIPNLDVLRAHLPLASRNFPYASSAMGVFMTPSADVALTRYLRSNAGTDADPDSFARAYEYYTDPDLNLTPDQAARLAGAGRIYEAEPSISNAYDMPYDEMREFYTTDRGQIRKAQRLRRSLISQGRDGIVVWKYDPIVQPDGTVLPQHVADIEEVVSFDDVPIKPYQYHVPADSLNYPSPVWFDDFSAWPGPPGFDPLLPASAARPAPVPPPGAAARLPWQWGFA